MARKSAQDQIADTASARRETLDWRSAHGGVRPIDQLPELSGIEPAKFAAIKDLVLP